MKRNVLMSTILTAIAVMCMSVAPAAAAAPSTAKAKAPSIGSTKAEWMQVSFIIADGANIGTGVALGRSTKLALNLDLRSAGNNSLDGSLLLAWPGTFFVLTSAYGGAGATWEFASGRVYPHLIGGGEFGPAFAEYEWVMSPHGYGKIRSGLRWRF